MQLEIVLHSRQQAWAAIQAQEFPFLKTVMQAGGRDEAHGPAKPSLLRKQCGKIQAPQHTCGRM